MLTVPTALFATSYNQLLLVGGGTYAYTQYPVPPFRLVEMHEGAFNAEKINRIGGGEAYCGIEYLPSLPMTTRPGKRQVIPAVDYPLELTKEFPEKVQELTALLHPSGRIDPYPLYLDIETASTEEHFPKPERDPIISIQLKYPDSEMSILLNEDMTDYSEYLMIMKFLEWVRVSPTHKTPDYIVGYNVNRFDIPYIKTRIRKLRRTFPDLGTTYDNLSRAPRNEVTGAHGIVFYSGWLFSGKLQGEILDFIPGLLTLDLFVHAKTDLELQQLPSRGMKNVAKAYGCDVFDIESSEKQDMAALLRENKERFMHYSGSDIVATEYLDTIYKTRLVASSNLLICPLSMTHRMSSGQKSYLALYRECRKNHYFSFAMNEQRHADLYARARKYQGAIVACYQRGYFAQTVYLDAKSLYPNIMHDFNVSYDRYRLDSIIPYDQWQQEYQTIPRDAHFQEPLDRVYTPGEPCIISYGPAEHRIIYIPDENYKVVLKFTFDFVTDGFMRRLINHYNGVRDEFKNKSKEFARRYTETGDIRYKIDAMNYNSTQAEAKIINNTFYGIQGNRYYDIADLPAAIFITAMGRWTMTEMVRLFGKSSIIETDSVTGDTPVYVKSKITGMLDIITIADLHADPSIKHIAYDGEYQILTRNGWADIHYTKAHTVRKNIHRIKLSDGCVDCTADHSLFDADTHEMLSPLHIERDTRIELTERPEPDKNVTKADDLPLSMELAWFYGLFLAEGSYSVWHGTQKRKRKDGTYRIWKRNNRLLSISMNVRPYLETAQSICNEFLSPYCTNPGSKKPAMVHIYDTMKTSATYRLTGFTNTTAMNFFLKHFYCKDGQTKKVPTAILNCEDEVIINAFLFGYMLGDGTDRFTPSRRMIKSYTSIDTPLITGTRYLLKRVGKDTCVVKRKDKRHVTDIKIRHAYNTGTFRKIDKSRVLSNSIIIPDSEETLVYDICTADGTFVGAMGEIVLKNTDGVLLNQEHFDLTIDDINHQLKNRMHTFFGIPVHTMNFKLEFEDDGSVYMYKRKNYILRKNSDPDKLVIKGSAFKGYDKAPVIQRAVGILANAVMFHPHDSAAYEKACQEVRDVCEVYEREGLAPFKFTKTLKKNPDGYKGYRNVEVYVLSVDRSGNTKQILSAMKKRALSWIDTVFGKKKKNKRTRGDQYRAIIKACKNEEELKLALGLLAFAQPKKERTKSYHFLLDLIMRLQQRGRAVEAYDVLEYYYTRSAEQYTLASDIDHHTLNFEKYREEIEAIIKRFTYADPKRLLLTFHDVLDDDQNADEVEEVQNGFAYPEPTEEEWDSCNQLPEHE